MSQRSVVGGSLFRVVAFWWFAVLFWVSLSDARLLDAIGNVRRVLVETNRFILWALPSKITDTVLTWLPWNSPGAVATLNATKVIPLTLSKTAQNASGVVSSWDVMSIMVGVWVVPVLSITAVLLTIGWFSGWLRGVWSVQQHGRHSRVSGSQWNSVVCSIGPLLQPLWVQRNPPAGKPDDYKIPAWFVQWYPTYKARAPIHAALLQEIMATIGKSGSFAGEGHASLAIHTWGVLERAVTSSKITDDPLIPLVAAAHDLGKVITHAKSVKANNQHGYHDTLGMRILSTLNMTTRLPGPDYEILMLLTGFAHKSSKRPHLKYGDDTQQSRMLMVRDMVHAADGQATASEQKETREAPGYQDIMEVAFFEMLRMASRLPEKENPVNPHIRDSLGVHLLRMSENRVAKLLMTALGNDAAATGCDRRSQDNGGISGVMWALMQWLDARGWLLHELYGAVDPYCMFDVRAGNARNYMPFNGVIFVNVKEDLKTQLRKKSLTKMLIEKPVYPYMAVRAHRISPSDKDLTSADLDQINKMAGVPYQVFSEPSVFERDRITVATREGWIPAATIQVLTEDAGKITTPEVLPTLPESVKEATSHTAPEPAVSPEHTPVIETSAVTVGMENTSDETGDPAVVIPPFTVGTMTWIDDVTTTRPGMDADSPPSTVDTALLLPKEAVATPDVTGSFPDDTPAVNLPETASYAETLRATPSKRLRDVGDILIEGDDEEHPPVDVSDLVTQFALVGEKLKRAVEFKILAVHQNLRDNRDSKKRAELTRRINQKVESITCRRDRLRQNAMAEVPPPKYAGGNSRKRLGSGNIIISAQDSVSVAGL